MDRVGKEISVINQIVELENNDTVVVAMKLEDGTIKYMEEITDGVDYQMAIELATVSVEEYEANGYEADGLELTWLQL